MSIPAPTLSHLRDYGLLSKSLEKYCAIAWGSPGSPGTIGDVVQRCLPPTPTNHLLLHTRVSVELPIQASDNIEDGQYTQQPDDTELFDMD